MDFSGGWFFDLDARLRVAGLDSDIQSFDEILENLRDRKNYNLDEFVSHCAYVILAGDFIKKLPCYRKNMSLNRTMER